MAFNYEKVEYGRNKADNPGGIQQKAYFISLFDLSTVAVAVAPSAATNINQLGVIDDDHIPAVGKGFIEVYCTLDKGSFDAEPQGDRDGRSYKTMGKIFVPGTDDVAFGTVYALKNDRTLWLFPFVDNDYAQVGSGKFYAEALGKFGTATNSQGVRGTELEISAMEMFYYKYKGIVTLQP